LKTIISKWEFNDLLKFSERKSKKIHLDFTNSEFDFEATKSDVENIMKRLNEIKDPNLVIKSIYYHYSHMLIFEHTFLLKAKEKKS